MQEVVDDDKRCEFYLPKKKRFCKCRPAPNSIYCFTHLNDDASNTMNDESKVRVPCPVDPSHTVYKKALKKHIKICNASLKEEQLISQPFYSHHINTTATNERERLLFCSHAASSIQQPQQQLEQQQQQLEKDQQDTVLNQWLNQVSENEFQSLVNKIKNLYEKYQIDDYIKYEELRPTLCTPFFEYEQSQQMKMKHVKQQCSMIGHMIQNQCLSEGHDYYEFGCGKAELSYLIRQCILLQRTHTSEILQSQHQQHQQQYIVIDRKLQRRKNDNSIRYGLGVTHEEDSERKRQIKKTENTIDPTVSVERVQIDISHLNLSNLHNNNHNNNHNKNNSCVCISKHLCGVATDLTLRCVTQTRGEHQHIRGIFIALCCHHICNWNSYVNQNFFIQEDFREEEFERMKLLTSWATCNFRNREVDPNPVFGMQIPDKVQFGRMCKRVIDYGRVLYLNQLGFNAKLVHYCDAVTTPENCLLVATTATATVTE